MLRPCVQGRPVQGKTMPTAEPPSFTLAELAHRLRAELVGDPDLRISGVRGLDEAGPHDLTFVSNPRYASRAQHTRAGAVLVTKSFTQLATATLRVEDPYLTLSAAIELFHAPRRYRPGLHPTAVVDSSAQLGQRIHIGPYVVVMEGVVLGDDCVLLPHTVIYPGVRIGQRALLHAHVVVREDCVLGDDVILQSGVIIGADGFGFAKLPSGSWKKIHQAGRVVVENQVEVQANSCIDRGALGDTLIRRGAKIDNLVQVGHGSTVGENTLLCAQVGLAGSTSVGRNVILAGQVGVAGHCTIGDGVIATAQTGIPGDVQEGLTVSGYPAVENRQWLKGVAALNRLPSLLRNLYKERK